MGFIGDLAVDQIIKEAIEDRHMSYGQFFWNDRGFNLNFRMDKIDDFSNIRLTLFGNDTKVLRKNDSIAYYYSILRNFSISSHGIEPQDIFWADPNGVSYPTEILFIKRDKYLYLYLLNKIQGTTLLSPYLLYDLIIKK